MWTDGILEEKNDLGKMLRGGLQEVITNLMIARIQVRGEADPDVAPHVHHRQVETVLVSPSPELGYCRDTLLALLRSVISRVVALRVSPALQRGANRRKGRREGDMESGDGEKEGEVSGEVEKMGRERER